MRTSSNSSSSKLKPPWKVSSYNVPRGEKKQKHHHKLARKQLGAADCPIPPCKWKAEHPLHLLGNNSSFKQLETVLCPHGKEGISCTFFLFAAAYVSLMQASGWRKNTEVTDCTSRGFFFVVISPKCHFLPRVLNWDFSIGLGKNTNRK